jgi:class 3 adenylate cyclase
MTQHADEKAVIADQQPVEESDQGYVILATAEGEKILVRDGDIVGRTAVGRELLGPFAEISRRHAQFICQEECWSIIDLNSSNGTFLDGHRLPAQQPTPFATGQRIDLTPALPLRVMIVKPELESAAEIEDPNRRTLTILFADVKGSVDFFQERGTLIAKNWIFRLFQMLTEIIEEHGGTHLKNIGDALLAIFEEPRSAAKAAVKMQRVVWAHNQIADPADHYFLRIGMSMGSVLFENNDVFGNAVNIASRVQDLAPPERIYITDALRQHLAPVDHPHLRSIGHIQLKGVKATTEVFEILPAR